ncbi:MAG: 5'(3')-deoxyribonucleotidase [Tannerellaceae bacterium]|jgi:5'(3')-deoxyribonucleotidase|nr:5'(3')-deoxyribonucleotidase [Tannerellaceae bacterium]
MNDRKQILVDMDGVLADVYKQFQLFEKQETGKERKPEEVTGLPEYEAFPNSYKYVNIKGFFRNAPVIEGSIEGLNYLNNKYNVLVVSSATEFPNSLKEKLEWLNEHYPFITWKQLILCGTKDSIKGDIMIDDHLKNLDCFEGEKMLFTQPHNMLINSPLYKRIYNWNEIIEKL